MVGKGTAWCSVLEQERTSRVIHIRIGLIKPRKTRSRHGTPVLRQRYDLNLEGCIRTLLA